MRSVWNKKPTKCHLVLYSFLLYKLLFISCSKCFGPPCAHPQEQTTLWYFFACGVLPWLCRQSHPVGWLCVHWEVRSATYFFACGVLPWLCRQSHPVGWLCVHWEVRSATYFFACGVLPWLCRQSHPVGWLCVHWEVRSVTYFPMNTQPANRMWLPTQPRQYTTREKIPQSRLLLRMSTRWPETCWTTYKE